jgi:hypothetical protein
MLNLVGIAIIGKAAREALENVGALFNFTQQQSTTVGTDLATIEFTYHHTATQAVKF